MSSHDIHYYCGRAAQEREAANQSDKQFLAEIHLELARAYEALAENPELRTLRVITA